MNKKDKIILNKTLYLLRKLPDKNRVKLAEFIFEEREHGSSYIATEMFEYLTGSLSPKLRSIYTFNFATLTHSPPPPPVIRNMHPILL